MVALDSATSNVLGKKTLNKMAFAIIGRFI